MRDQTLCKDLVSLSKAHLNRVGINFDKLILQLKRIYEDELVSPDVCTSSSLDRRFLPGGRAVHTLQRQDVKEIVVGLYDLTRKYCKRNGWFIWRKERRCWNQTNDATRTISSETWFERVCGNDLDHADSDLGRAKILATLVLSEVKLTSAVWTTFVQRCLASPIDREDRLCDRLLPFREHADITKWFGNGDDCHGLTCEIFVNQRLVCPYIINGPQDEVPPGARLPYYQERPIQNKVDREGYGLWKLKADTQSCRGSVPSGWIARKDVRKDKTAQAEERIYRRFAELEIQQHIHILKFYGIAKLPQKSSFFMELAACSLYEHMQEDIWPDFNADPKIDFFEAVLGIGRALVFLHEHGIHHRDIRSANVMLARDEEGNEKPLHWLIADFGLSNLASGNDNEVVRRVDQLHHCPPEFLQNLSPAPILTSSGDVWSYACLCLEILVWLLGGRKGLDEFCTARENVNCKDLEISANRWYFTVDLDSERSEEDCDSALDTPRSCRDYYAWKRTQKGYKPIVIRNNQAVREYIEDDCRGEDRGRLKMFVLDVFERLSQFALVPNPSERATMRDLCGQLEAAIAQFRR